MKNIYKLDKWILADQPLPEICNITLVDRKQSISIYMFDVMKKRRVQVTFQGGAISYRGQIPCLSFLKLNDQIGWSLYTTKCSSYIKWFLKESFGIYSEEELLHYIFIGKNIVLDVIHSRDYDPIVEVFY